MPGSMRMNRGKRSLVTLAEKALECEAGRIIVSDSWKGGVGKIQLFRIGEVGLDRYYPLIYVKNVKLRREFGHARSRTAQSLVLQTAAETSFEAKKLADALATFLSIPCLPREDTVTPKTIIHISLNNAHRIQITFFQAPPRVEVGPRITVSHLIWKARK